MPPYHPLTHITGSVTVSVFLLLCVLSLHAARSLRSHRRAEAARARNGTSSPVAFAGQSLATLLRCAVLAVTFTGAVAEFWALCAAWLQVDESDASIQHWSPIEPPPTDVSTAGKLCVAFSKIGPGGYVATKGFGYVFFWVKSRTVRPMERVTWLQKLILAATLGVFVFALAGVWLLQGSRSPLDGSCVFRVPVWMLLVLLGADTNLSFWYMMLFISPLRETIRANKEMHARMAVHAAAAAIPAVASPMASPRNHAAAVLSPGRAPATTLTIPTTPHRRADSSAIGALSVSIVHASPSLSPSSTEAGPASSTPTAASIASARGKTLESVMRKNMRSCAISIASTSFTLSFITAAHLTDNDVAMKLVWGIGDLDIGVTCLAIFLLMSSSSSPSSSSVAPTTAAAGGGGGSGNGAAGAGATGPGAIGVGAAGTAGGVAAETNGWVGRHSGKGSRGSHGGGGGGGGGSLAITFALPPASSTASPMNATASPGAPTPGRIFSFGGGGTSNRASPRTTPHVHTPLRLTPRGGAAIRSSSPVDRRSASPVGAGQARPHRLLHSQSGPSGRTAPQQPQQPQQEHQQQSSTQQELQDPRTLSGGVPGGALLLLLNSNHGPMDSGNCNNESDSSAQLSMPAELELTSTRPLRSLMVTAPEAVAEEGDSSDHQQQQQQQQVRGLVQQPAAATTDTLAKTEDGIQQQGQEAEQANNGELEEAKEDAQASIP